MNNSKFVSAISVADLGAMFLAIMRSFDKERQKKNEKELGSGLDLGLIPESVFKNC